jgi:FlaA1/EpsC-like NDP-sugar epimerase
LIIVMMDSLASRRHAPPGWTVFVGFALLLSVAHGFSLHMSSANKDKVNVIAGATGYIGKSVVRESVRQGYQTVALVRDKSKVESAQGKALYGDFFEGARVVECNVADPDELLKVGTCEAI